MPSLGSIFTGILQILGIIDWAKAALQTHIDKQAGIALQVATDNAGTVQEVAHIEGIRNEVQNLSHDELITQYARMQASVRASNSGSGQ